MSSSRSTTRARGVVDADARLLDPLAIGVKGLGRALSIARGPRLSILIFHRVLPRLDALLPGESDATLFEARMRWVASAFRVLPLVEATRRLADGSLPANVACITFDDGYADNLTIATPILCRLRLPATFFIATGFLDGGRMFNDTVIESVRAAKGPTLDATSIGLGTWPVVTDAARVAAIDGLLAQVKYLEPAVRSDKVDALADLVGLPRQCALMMTRAQVAQLRRSGMSIGAHTVSHPILTSLSATEAEREIDEGRRDLADIVGERVRAFAYPNGRPQRDYDASHVAMVRRMGFDAAVSTAQGVAARNSDRYQLPRFTPWDTNVHRFGLRLATNALRGSPEAAAT